MVAIFTACDTENTQIPELVHAQLQNKSSVVQVEQLWGLITQSFCQYRSICNIKMLFKFEGKAPEL